MYLLQSDYLPFSYFLNFLAYMYIFTIFSESFIFAFVLFSLVFQSLESPSPLRDLMYCLFYFLLVFLWFDVDLYNISVLHLWECRLTKVGELQVFRVKLSMRFFMSWPVPTHLYLQWPIWVIFSAYYFILRTCIVKMVQ